MKGYQKLLLCCLPLAAAGLSLFCGRYPIGARQVLETLLHPVRGENSSVSLETYTVIWQLRVPRILAGGAVGAGLGASGAALQGVFKNLPVSSGLLGVSAGAGFGAALSILLCGVTWMTYLFSFAFGIAAVFLSYWVAHIYKTVPTVMLVLGGTIVSSLFNALIALLKYVSDPERQLPAIVYWLMGSLSSVGSRDLWALLPVACGLLVLLAMGWKINVLSMGDKEARTMGVDVRVCKTLVICGASLATAGAVCLSGIVGWVGLVIPHIGRMAAGNDNRTLLPVSISFGAAFMIVIDTVSRVLAESEIPLGILTALIGAPFFIYLLKKTKGGGWSA